jgi:cyanate permease
MSTTTSAGGPARGRPPHAAEAVSALAVLGVVVVAFNMRTAIGEIPPVLPDLGLSSAGQSILATVPVVCFGRRCARSSARNGGSCSCSSSCWAA